MYSTDSEPENDASEPEQDFSEPAEASEHEQDFSEPAEASEASAAESAGSDASEQDEVSEESIWKALSREQRAEFMAMKAAERQAEYEAAERARGVRPMPKQRDPHRPRPKVARPLTVAGVKAADATAAAAAAAESDGDEQDRKRPRA